MIIRIAILDDYLNVARSCADWESLDGVDELTVFIEHIDDLDELADALQGYDVISVMRERTPFPAELIRRLPDLQLIVTTAMYNATIDVEAATSAGILVCGTAGLPSATPELTWALILAVTRDVPAQDRAIREGRWQTTLGSGLEGKRLGIIGLGRIGGRIASYAQAFGMDVVAWSQNLTQERADEVGVRLVTKEGLLQTSDIVTIHVRGSERTFGLLGRRELAMMKPTSYLVNTSRGPIVDEGVLIEALSEGRIAGAGLDVYSQEPIDPDHALLRLDNTVLTPHIGYVTRETFEIFYGDTVEAIAAFHAGAPIRVLNPEART